MVPVPVSWPAENVSVPETARLALAVRVPPETVMLPALEAEVKVREPAEIVRLLPFAAIRAWTACVPLLRVTVCEGLMQAVSVPTGRMPLSQLAAVCQVPLAGTKLMVQ